MPASMKMKFGKAHHSRGPCIAAKFHSKCVANESQRKTEKSTHCHT